MPEEKEIKIELKIPLKKFLRLIQKHGFKRQSTIHQLDIYFDTKEWWLYKNVATIRARKVNDKEETFSFKKIFYLPHRKRKWYLEEVETTFPLCDTDKLEQIFQRIQIPYKNTPFKDFAKLKTYLYRHNLFDEQKMKKSRTIYTKKDNEIVIDDVEHVGIIIELECRRDDPFQVANSILEPEEWERFNQGTSYLWLEKVKGFRFHRKCNAKFEKKPDWNVWEHEREMYQNLNSRKKNH